MGNWKIRITWWILTVVVICDKETDTNPSWENESSLWQSTYAIDKLTYVIKICFPCTAEDSWWCNRGCDLLYVCLPMGQSPLGSLSPNMINTVVTQRATWHRTPYGFLIPQPVNLISGELWSWQTFVLFLS